MQRIIQKLIVESRMVFPEKSIKSYWKRMKTITIGIRHRHLVAELLDARPDSEVSKMMKERTQTIGILLWPYQCSAWSPRERLDRIINHCHVIEDFGGGFQFSVHDRMVIADLDSVHKGVRILLDKPQWFMREGQLTMNLFVDNFRAYSVAFSFYRESSGVLKTVIGSVQGRNTQRALGLYRELTKSFYGMRPRDLLIEMVRFISEQVGCEQILAISDEYRHHRHPFFGQREFPTDYNKIWIDRNGVRDEKFFYNLAVEKSRRDLESIKSKKRSLYRKRYQFLDNLESQMNTDFKKWKSVRFIDL